MKRVREIILQMLIRNRFDIYLQRFYVECYVKTGLMLLTFSMAQISFPNNLLHLISSICMVFIRRVPGSLETKAKEGFLLFEKKLQSEQNDNANTQYQCTYFEIKERGSFLDGIDIE